MDDVAGLLGRLVDELEARSAPPGPRVFTAAEVGDPKFFAEHREEIREAIRAGRVEGTETHE